MCNCKWFFRVGCFEQPVSPPGSCTLPPCDKNGATATGLGAVKLPKVQLVPSSKSLPWPLRLKRWCGSGAWQLRRCVFSCIHLSQYIDLWDCFNCARIKLQFLRSCKCKMVPRKHWFLRECNSLWIFPILIWSKGHFLLKVAHLLGILWEQVWSLLWPKSS